MSFQTWLSTIEADFKGINWKEKINAVSSELNAFAKTASAVLEALPEHTAIMLAIQAVDNMIVNVTAVVDTETAPVAAVAPVVAPVA
jgi:hypothetical protein